MGGCSLLARRWHAWLRKQDDAEFRVLIGEADVTEDDRAEAVEVFKLRAPHWHCGCAPGATAQLQHAG